MFDTLASTLAAAIRRTNVTRALRRLLASAAKPPKVPNPIKEARAQAKRERKALFRQRQAAGVWHTHDAHTQGRSDKP